MSSPRDTLRFQSLSQENEVKTWEKNDKKPNLLKRVGKSLLRIAEAPLHVVGGALEATWHLLNGRLDRSANSLIGGVRVWLGSLNEWIRQIPLVGDVVQKVEKTAFGIHEKLGFTKDEKDEIVNAEDKFLKTTLAALDKKYAKMNNDELSKEATTLRTEVKKNLEETIKNPPQTAWEITEDGYYSIQSALPGSPEKFSDLTDLQKKMLQWDYFKREPKPDLRDTVVSEYFKRLMSATKNNATQEDQNKLMMYAIEKMPELQNGLHMTPIEINMANYFLNSVERSRRQTGWRAPELQDAPDDARLQTLFRRAIMTEYRGLFFTEDSPSTGQSSPGH